MSVILHGVTHVIITTTPTKEEAAKTKIYAAAEICFGPGNDNSVAQLDLVQLSNKQMVWKLPVVFKEKAGTNVPMCVFNGALAAEVSQWASVAIERIKKEIGVPKLGKIFYVPTKGKVQDITDGGMQ